MTELSLIEPTIEYADDIWAFWQEIMDYDKERVDGGIERAKEEY